MEQEETKEVSPTTIGGPYLEYEQILLQDLMHTEDDEAENPEHLPSGGQCFTVVARGFSIPKLVACLLYEYYSLPRENGLKICSPFLIFILNFDEVDHKALEMNIKWLEAHDQRPERQAIRINMLT